MSRSESVCRHLRYLAESGVGLMFTTAIVGSRDSRGRRFETGQSHPVGRQIATIQEAMKAKSVRVGCVKGCGDGV